MFCGITKERIQKWLNTSCEACILVCISYLFITYSLLFIYKYKTSPFKDEEPLQPIIVNDVMDNDICDLVSIGKQWETIFKGYKTNSCQLS